MPIRVMHVYKSFPPDTWGGVEAMIQTLADVASDNVQHALMVPASVAQPQTCTRGRLTVHRYPATVHVASCPISTSMWWQGVRRMNGVDIVHTHAPYPWADAMLCARQPSIPTVVTYHSDVVKQRCLKRLYQPLMHAFLRRAAAIVPTSEAYVASSPVLQRYRDRCTVIPVGLHDHPPQDVERVARWRARVGEGFVLFMGVLRYYKGLPTLLDALQREPLPCVVIGDGPLRGRLQTTLERHRMHHVQWVGRLDDADKHALLTLCGSVVLPSHQRSEAYGLALIEGAMHGKPLVSCELGTGTSVINQHGVTGWVVPPSDPEALASALRRLVEAPEVAQRMGTAARVRYEQHYRANTMGERYEALYRQVLSAQ